MTLAPQPALLLTRDRVLFLLEALSREEEHADRMGCTRSATMARQMIGELRGIAKEAARDERAAG